jgi:hypothetical protein
MLLDPETLKDTSNDVKSFIHYQRILLSVMHSGDSRERFQSRSWDSGNASVIKNFF